MFTKLIKYTDYNGVDREETLHFNLNKVEVTDLELLTVGGFEQMVTKIQETKDIPKLVALFKELILKSYGVKSDDGRRFIKSKELSEEFSQTEAFVEMYMWLLENEQHASDFINGIVPKVN